MSMQDDVTYGFGFCVNPEEIRISLSALTKMAKNIPELSNLDFKKMSLDDFQEIGETLNHGLGYVEIVAEAIRQKENISVCTVADDDNFLYVLFFPGYPWELNSHEKTLTEEKLQKIFEKYAQQLLNDSSCVGYCEVHRFE